MKSFSLYIAITYIIFCLVNLEDQTNIIVFIKHDLFNLHLLIYFNVILPRHYQKVHLNEGFFEYLLFISHHTKEGHLFCIIIGHHIREGH
jgi:hypothetical protein